MFLHCINPLGVYTSLALAELPVWRLELGTSKPPAAEQQEPSTNSLVVLRISYLAAGMTARQIVAGVDVLDAATADAIARIGVAEEDRHAAKERLREAAKALYNVEELRKAADELVPQVGMLADLFFELLDALQSKTDVGGLVRPVGIPLKGRVGGWRVAVTAARFEPWSNLPDTWGVEVTRATEPSGGMEPRPAPGRIGPLGGNPPPDGTAPPSRRGSREQRRAARESQSKEGGAGTANPAPGAGSTPDSGTPPTAGEQSASPASGEQDV